MKKLLFVLPIFLCFSVLRLGISQPQSPTPWKPQCLTSIPNAITPNGDGINDYFTVKYSCEPVHFVLEIYDQTQELIFESSDIHAKWNGLILGAPAPEGRYSWRIRYVQANGEVISRSGELVLVR